MTEESSLRKNTPRYFNSVLLSLERRLLVSSKTSLRFFRILNTRLTVIKKQFNTMMLKCEQCDLPGSKYVTLLHIA